MAVVKEGDQDFAKRFLKATAQESLSEVNQTLQIQKKNTTQKQYAKGKLREAKTRRNEKD